MVLVGTFAAVNYFVREGARRAAGEDARGSNHEATAAAEASSSSSSSRKNEDQAVDEDENATADYS